MNCNPSEVYSLEGLKLETSAFKLFTDVNTKLSFSTGCLFKASYTYVRLITCNRRLTLAALFIKSHQN